MNPINPINRQKKDLADKILQGLQLAEAAFKIPVAYEQIRAYSADADVKSQEAESLANLREGTVDPYAQVKYKLRRLPNGQTGAVVPPSEAKVIGSGPALTPPTSALAPPPEAGPALAPPAPAPSPLLPRGAFQGKNGAFISDETATKNDEDIEKTYDRVYKITQANEASNKAIATIEELHDLAASGNAAAQLQYLKAFNQFNDTPRFTEGEANAFQSMNSLATQGRNLLKDLLEGEKVFIDPKIISQIRQASLPLAEVVNQSHKDALTPLYAGAQRKQMPVNEIFSPQAMSLLEGKLSHPKLGPKEPVIRDGKASAASKSSQKTGWKVGEVVNGYKKVKDGADTDQKNWEKVK